MPVHPRACGERCSVRSRCHPCFGSSPRLRGTRGRLLITPPPERFIPAPAGNAPSAPLRPDHQSVHPRACGERFITDKAGKKTRGSSPRLRGTHHAERIHANQHRFIPAPAGNAWPWLFTGSLLAVHPRACGERVYQHDSFALNGGSSPRLRGTRALAANLGDGHRFIPAPAGNAARSGAPGTSEPVHPRACGERGNTSEWTGTGFGSSPRLRGTLVISRLRRIPIRFIPAPAGNAPAGRASMLGLSVHPRACGERTTSLAYVPLVTGSSPRLRGTQDRHALDPSRNRFIPAPAGNASTNSAKETLLPVHPRACGERK